ncbi:hypothetical protein [Bifidobacterium adolescentis]|uniref:hypothetical protein n=1 Tax=Bifidobacterium adolescentis TaxID=1680 RepID=UPI003BB7F40B
MNDVGTLDTSIWAGYIVRPKGDMRRYTCRVYETLQEASDVAQERADSHHRPYEVRVTCDTSQRIIKTIEPRKKILENMIIKWHQAGYSLDEIAPLVPQVPKAEIEAIIQQHDKETRL